MKQTKFVAFDIETTGLDAQIHEIIEIGGVLFSYDLKKKIYKKDREFVFKIKPEHIETADKTALKVNGYKDYLWEDALPLKNVLKKVNTMCKDRTMVGHNVFFDFYFFNEMCKKSKIKNQFHYHTIDTVSIAFAMLQNNSNVKRLSLSYLCDYLGIKNKKAHSALGDANATYELFVKLIEFHFK